MGTLFAIGEVLIDFIPLEKGMALKDVKSFERAAGGAPANVAAAAATLGANASVITKLGNDAFGDFLIDQLLSVGVQTNLIKRTNEANTGLAFVSLQADGERDFSFYRNPSSDLLLTEEEIDSNLFTSQDILHFGSVDLIESPMKHAHVRAINEMKKKGGLISFDPNVRLPLWHDHEEYRRTIQSFIPQSNLLKISEDELEFITGISDKKKAISSLFIGDVQAILYTKGKQGAQLFLKDRSFDSHGYQVDVQDTTGAGDAFMGAFLYQLLQYGVQKEKLHSILLEHNETLLQFANASGALTTTRKGAFPALPTLIDVQQCMRKGMNINA